MAESPGFLGCIKTRELKILAEKRQFLRIARNLGATFVALFAFAIVPAFAALPAGYTELEYIESTGTQYIDTGIVPEAGTHAKIKYAYISTSGWAYSFGDQETEGHYFALRLNNSGKLQFLAGRSIIDTDITPISGTPFTAELSVSGTSATYTVNDVSNIETIEFSSEPGTKHIGIFANGDGGNMFKSSARCYGFSVDNNGTMIRNMIPMRRDSDGVLGMYDTVSNTFFTNAGTGTFTAGPAKCRNLFGVPKNLSGATFDVNTGTITNTVTDTRVPIHLFIELYNSNNTYLSKAYDENISSPKTFVKTFTTTSETHYLRLLVNGANVNPATTTWAVKPSTTYTLSMNIAGVDPTTIGGIVFNNVQLEEGSTATDYVPYCGAEIKIATTAYNAAAFAPVEAALESAVTTIKDVVANTITQADAIQNLQDAKQTRPDAECPAGKTCLLVQDADGTPHWYEIVTEYIPPEPTTPEPATP